MSRTKRSKLYLYEVFWPVSYFEIYRVVAPTKIDAKKSLLAAFQGATLNDFPILGCVGCVRAEKGGVRRLGAYKGEE